MHEEAGDWRRESALEGNGLWRSPDALVPDPRVRVDREQRRSQLRGQEEEPSHQSMLGSETDQADHSVCHSHTMNPDSDAVAADAVAAADVGVQRPG